MADVSSMRYAEADCRSLEEKGWDVDYYKPTDAVIVGMYQQLGDQVGENAVIVRSLGLRARGAPPTGGGVHRLGGARPQAPIAKSMNDQGTDPKRVRTVVLGTDHLVAAGGLGRPDPTDRVAEGPRVGDGARNRLR
jgi:hypothetical protein